MKNPMRDWRLVAALSVLAAGSAGFNVVQPWLADGLSATAVEQDALIAVPELSEGFVASTDSEEAMATIPRIRVTAVEHLPRFSVASIQGRDPFSAAQPTASPLSLAAFAPSIFGSADAPQAGLPKVSAIVVTDRWRAAIIDGQFVATGQRIGDRVVARIDHDTVQLRGTDQEAVSLAFLGAAP